MKLDLPKFETNKERLDYIVQNEEAIFAVAKSTIKEADAIGGAPIVLRKDIEAAKATPEELLEKDVITGKLAINTTNVIDSHLDLHIPGLWDKSLQENKRILHLAEHKRSFDSVISRGEDLKAYTEELNWKQLGFDMEGTTEVLTFDSKIRKSQHEEMFREYAKGNVTEHSVGMQYVKLVTCINDEEYPVQYENWQKYFPMAANGESFKGDIFWAVLEAKVIEGSAVLMGSNPFTPTESIKEETPPPQKSKKTEAVLKWLQKR